MAAEPGRSLLILSCDIVGSTAYKQTSVGTWQRTFLSFYREFPQQLATVAKAVDLDVEFQLWKGIGDELLYTCEVRCPTQVFHAVRTWIAAMDAYERSSLTDYPLGTKGGAFLATFPGPDSECTIPRDPSVEADSDKGVVTLNAEALSSMDHTKFHFDYFGPSIDTGFRVLSEATSRNFALSVEVAYAMQYCQSQAAAQQERFGACANLIDLVLLGTRPLKGVWGDREYPILVLDRAHEDPVNVAMRSVTPQTGLGEIGDLCLACMQSHGWPSAIYLPDVDFEPFNSQPTPPESLVPDNAMEGAETEPPNEAGPARDLDEDAPTE